MKKIFLLLITLLTLPFVVFADEEPLFYVEGSKSAGEGYGYFFENNYLDLNGYDGGQIIINGNSTEELNITVRLFGENNITVDGESDYGIVVTNGNGKANVIIEKGNATGKLNINTNFGGVFADNQLTINETNININSKSAIRKNVSDALITSENLNVINSKLDFINQKLNENGKTDFDAIYTIDKFESINSNIGATGVNSLFYAKYVNFNKSNVNLKSGYNLGVILEKDYSINCYPYFDINPDSLTKPIPFSTVNGEVTKDNYIKISDSNITLDNSTGGFKSNSNTDLIETVEVKNSNINYKNNNETTANKERSLFTGADNITFDNSKVTGDNLYYAVYTADNINLNKTSIDLINTRYIFDSQSVIITINVKDSSIKSENKNKTVEYSNSTMESIIQSENITIDNSNIYFNNVQEGLYFYNTMNINNSDYYYNGIKHGIAGQYVLNINNSKLDITSKEYDAIGMGFTVGSNDEKLTVNIDKNLVVDNNYNFLSCSSKIDTTSTYLNNKFLYITEGNDCPSKVDNYDLISNVKTLKIYPKVEERKKDNNETNNENPETGSFLNISLIILAIGGAYIYFKTKNKKSFLN